MTGRVEEGDDLYALGVCIGDDRVHLVLTQLPAAGSGIIIVAGLNGRLYVIAGVVFAICCDGHIIQQEAQAVVAKGQFQMGIVIFAHDINDALELIHGEILSSAVNMIDLHEPVRRFGSRHRRRQ